MRDYSLGPRFESGEHYALLRHCATIAPEGTALEFGVGGGESTRIIAEHMPVIGFDSWLGLPADWRPGFPKGSFAAMPPTIPNVELVDGWYEDTLPTFDFGLCGRIALVHIDCDLYSSTKTVLRHAGPSLAEGTIVVFDEWHGYDNADLFEQLAWKEYVAGTPHLGWTVIGHGHEQWAIQIGR